MLRKRSQLLASCHILHIHFFSVFSISPVFLEEKREIRGNMLDICSDHHCSVLILRVSHTAYVVKITFGDGIKSSTGRYDRRRARAVLSVLPMMPLRVQHMARGRQFYVG